ncbi:Citrate transporter [Carex littledalei]|uniref:Citrate transporter n=1 Tax=Carex littledalei TaxID=544730 RepID=A0A833QJV8_9POAL|nr:Citrate transporter [Carex littledalei]
MFKYLGKLKEESGWYRLAVSRLSRISFLKCTLFTNDTVRVVLIEFILKIAKQNDMPAQPFLLALASSTNIGSAVPHRSATLLLSMEAVNSNGTHPVVFFFLILLFDLIKVAFLSTYSISLMNEGRWNSYSCK